MDCVLFRFPLLKILSLLERKRTKKNTKRLKAAVGSCKLLSFMTVSVPSRMNTETLRYTATVQLCVRGQQGP